MDEENESEGGSPSTTDDEGGPWADSDLSATFEARLHSTGVSFESGDSALLRAIDETGSLNAAADSLGRSYSHAHRRLATLEAAFGTLVDTQRGGSGGGGSRLTERAYRLLATFERLRTELSGVTEVTETVFEGQVVDRTGRVVTVETSAGRLHAVAGTDATAVSVTVRADSVTLSEDTDAPPATSARNRLHGTVAGVEKRDGIARVAVAVGADRPLAALLTAESRRRLRLTAGSRVLASFKTTATRATPQPGPTDSPCE